VTRIAHLSDLHFGRLRSETIEPLLAALNRLEPDVVVVSGDLTQRATKSQFAEARAFLRQLPDAPRVVVPGNHDIPLYNLWRRFVRPRKRFDRYITPERLPVWTSDDLAVVGIDTARSWAVSNGRINDRQVRALRERFVTLPPRALRVVVAHHPFVLPDEIAASERVGRADMALAAFVDTTVDLLLTGHRHIPWVSPLATRVPTVHAGTTTSSRTRGAGNSFHELVVDRHRVTIHRHAYRPSRRAFSRSGPPAVLPRDDDGRLASREPSPPGDER